MAEMKENQFEEVQKMQKQMAEMRDEHSKEMQNAELAIKGE